MRSEAATRADFSAIRYAQVWEDADVLLAGLDIQPGDVCVSIASAGDNALALLTQDPSRVIALDLSPAQLACLELRVAAYASSRTRSCSSSSARAHRRAARSCSTVPAGARRGRARVLGRAGPPIEHGIGSAGKFERYFALFRKRVLPLVHSRPTVVGLSDAEDPAKSGGASTRNSGTRGAGGCCSGCSSRAP